MGMVKKFDVYLYESKTHTKPCVVISPDEMNALLPYVVIAPITKVQRAVPCRVGVKLKGDAGQIALDLMRTTSKAKLVKRAGALPDNLKKEIQELLKEFFNLK
jgi:mRNA interferase MazF